MIIFCFGSNYFGQLGIGSRVRDNPYSPSPFGFTSDESDESIDYDDVEDVQCGSNFTIVLSKAGLLKYCGTLCGIVRPALTPVIIRLPLKCKQIACGRKHAMVLMEKGVVLSWGMGYFGQLGHGGDASYENPRIIEY
jgi:alpha-tubulin suppressor-like RCC1 family protein